MIDSPEQYSENSSSENGGRAGWALRLHRLKFLLASYWWIIVLCVVLGLAVQGYRASIQASRYTSVAHMILNGHISMPQGAGGEVYSEDLMLFYGTQVALMKSAETFAQAVDRVKSLHPDVPVDETATIDALQLPKTSVFELRSTSLNPEFAQDLLDAVIDSYLSNKRGRRDRTTDVVMAGVTEEVSKLDAETRSDEQQLLDFQKENNVVFIEEQSSNAATYLVGLNNESARLTKEYDLLNLENQSESAQGKDTSGTTAAPAAADNAPLEQANAAITAQQELIEKLKISRDDYGVYLKDQHPKMIALSEAIDKEQRFLDVLKTRSSQTREAHRQDLELQIKNVQQQIADWNKKSLDLNQRLEIYEQLKAKIGREQTLYNQFASSIQNVDLSKSLDQDDVITMAKASPAVIIDPNYPRQLAIGLMAGVAVGFGLIYFISRMDNRINTPLQIEQNFALPLLGHLPRALAPKGMKTVPLLTENDQRHVLAESFRNIRSCILFRPSELARTTRTQSLMVTSAAPGEGKSTLAANLAITFAFAGTRVLLIDADLRRGVMEKLFETPAHVGLSEYLQNEVGWRDAIQSTHIPNLDLMVRGRVPRQAGDLLLSSAVDALLRESIVEYDLVLWDSAPILAADDAANLCPKVDGVIYVVRIGYSTIDSGHSALEELAQRSAKIVGVVANAVAPQQPGYRNKYRYKDYYKAPVEV